MAAIDDAVTLSTGDYDIASPADHARVRAMADVLLAGGVATDDLVALGADPQHGLDLRLSTKLARSRRAVEEAQWAGSLAVVFAMWGEQRRLRPRTDANPTGEDALHVKLDQLSWLFADTDVEWSIYAVDDGDPDDSAAVAQERADAHGLGRSVNVLRLSDAVPAPNGPLAGLAHVDDSRKGGAIVHGAHTAMQDGIDAVVLTDADNSVDLAQIGLLLDEHANGVAVVLGDRKKPESLLVKAEARWGPGIVALRHMQRMVGRALFERGLDDTQAAFKLYGREPLEQILARPSTFGFSVDADWLYGAIAGDHTIASVPFAFIDSFAESASIVQGPMTTWESLLRGLVEAARARGVDHHEEMAAVVDELADASRLEQVVQRVPVDLDGVDASRLGDPELMPPARLAEWIRSVSEPA